MQHLFAAQRNKAKGGPNPVLVKCTLIKWPMSRLYILSDGVMFSFTANSVIAFGANPLIAG